VLFALSYSRNAVVYCCGCEVKYFFRTSAITGTGPLARRVPGA